MSLPHETNLVMRYQSGGGMGELPAVREATLPVRLKG